MKISVMGLGYVGTVVAGCLAKAGHDAIGVDTDRNKVALVNAGKSPIVEPEVGEIIEQQVAAGRLTASSDAASAVEQSDLVLICVGSPGLAGGGVDLRSLRGVCEEIGAALRYHEGAPVIVVRSTLLPGTARGVVIPTLEQLSGKRAGVEFGVCVNPEFLREGMAVYDYHNPPKTVIGEFNAASGDRLLGLYSGMPGPLVRTDIETAEIVKYADNAWHALKVGFANEIGTLCKALELDGRRVMDIFCQDRKLNLSAYYLKPGFSFGGSCLPKDLRALLHKARSLDLSLPILSAVLPSNEQQFARGVQAVVDAGHRRIGMLGLGFKAGTDDLRESPLVELAERLIGKGFDVRVYDSNVHLAGIRGANREYLLGRIPHIARLMEPSMEAVLRHAQTIVIGNAAPEFNGVRDLLSDGQVVIDLVRVCDARSVAGVYEGICW
jgi:GDP-mannose 6-dehydrogenase